MFVYHEIGVQTTNDALVKTAAITANMLFIIGPASILIYVMNDESLTDSVAALLFSLTENTSVILAIINTPLPLLGRVMDANSTPILLLPLLLMVLYLMIGMITSPFGLCLVTAVEIGKIRFDTLSRAVASFVVPLLIVLALCTYLPGMML